MIEDLPIEVVVAREIRARIEKRWENLDPHVDEWHSGIEWGASESIDEINDYIKEIWNGH